MAGNYTRVGSISSVSTGELLDRARPHQDRSPESPAPPLTHLVRRGTEDSVSSHGTGVPLRRHSPNRDRHEQRSSSQLPPTNKPLNVTGDSAMKSRPSEQPLTPSGPTTEIHPAVSPIGATRKPFDIFIPEAYKTCDDDEREVYEEFIDEVFKPLMTKHKLKWYCFRNDAPTDGAINSKIREAQAQCWMSLIVLCKAILDNQYLQMLGGEHIIYLQIDTNIKELPGVLHQPTILRFIRDRELEVGMKRIKTDIDSKKTPPSSLDMEHPEATPHVTLTPEPQRYIPPVRQAVSEIVPREHREPIDPMHKSWHPLHRIVVDDEFEDEDADDVPELTHNSESSRSNEFLSIDDVDSIDVPSSSKRPLSIQRPSSFVKPPYDISLKVITDEHSSENEEGSFYKVEHPRTDASVRVSSIVDTPLPGSIDRDGRKFLELASKGKHDANVMNQKEADFFLRRAIPLALSKETRQYIALAYIASDIKYPTVIKQALSGLWELLVLRPHLIDEKFVLMMVKVEAVLRPRGDTRRWTVNADIAMMFIELYQMVISFIYLGSLSEVSLKNNITEEDLGEIRDGVTRMGQILKNNFPSLQTQFQYHQAKIIEPCVQSMLLKVRGVAKRSSKMNDARSKIVPNIHHLLKPEMDDVRRAELVKNTMQTFGCLQEHDQITVFHYCCLLTRDTQAEFRVTFEDIVKQMTEVLLKSLTKAVMVGLVFRCYGCDLTSIGTWQQQSNLIPCLDEKAPVASKWKKQRGERDGKTLLFVIKFLSKLFFHSDERLRKLLADNLLLMDSHDDKHIRSSFQDALTAAAVAHVEAPLRMYGLELRVEPQENFAATFSRLWPNDGTSFLYFHGSFGHLSPNILCKMVKITRRGHLIGSDDVAKTTQTIQAEIKALEYVHQRNDTCDHILDMLAFNADIRSGPLFYIVKCSNEQNLSSHLKDLRDKPNRYDVFKLVDFCLGALLALHFCKENKILVTSATAASFLIHQEGQSLIPKLALQEGFFVGSLEHQGEKYEKVPVEFSAPETLLKCTHSIKSMAYLTSMILFEILSLGVHPFEEIDLHSGSKILKILKYRLKPERRRVIPERLYMGLTMCWFSTPDKRANIEDLLPLFREFKNKHKLVKRKSSLADKSQDVMWSEECAYLRKLAWKQPPIPNMKRPTELQDLHRFSDMWKDPEDDEAYIQYCCGDHTQKCSPKELAESDDPMKIKRDVGHWSCPLVLRKPNAQAISKLQDMDHVNVAKVDLVQCRESRVCINTYSDTTVIEFMTGRHLPEPERIKIYKQMMDGVNYVHKQGFVHCHISPKAFYINPESHEVRLGNLGRCTLLNLDEFDEDITQAMCRPFKEIPRSSWRWLPMETLTSHCYRTSTDVFSLGLTIWVLETANCHVSTSEPLYSFAPFSYRAADELSTVHLSRHTLPRAADCPLNLDKLIQACTSYPACCRPIMTELVAFFAGPDSAAVILPDDATETASDYDTPRSLDTETTDVTRRRLSRWLLQGSGEQHDFNTMDARQYSRSMYAKKDFIAPAEYQELSSATEKSKVVASHRSSPLKSVRKSFQSFFGIKKKKKIDKLPAIHHPHYNSRLPADDSSSLYENTGVSQPFPTERRQSGADSECFEPAPRYVNCTNFKSLSVPDDMNVYDDIDEMVGYIKPPPPPKPRNLPAVNVDEESTRVDSVTVAAVPFPLARGDDYQYADMSNTSCTIRPMTTETNINTPAEPDYTNSTQGATANFY